jgi:hypothetical protein
MPAQDKHPIVLVIIMYALGLLVSTYYLADGRAILGIGWLSTTHAMLLFDILDRKSPEDSSRQTLNNIVKLLIAVMFICLITLLYLEYV